MKKMAIGNNLGNSDSMLIESRNFDLYYRGTLSSVFDYDISIEIAAWRNLDLQPLIETEYKNWYNSLEQNDKEDIGFEKIFIKKFEIIHQINPIKYLKFQKKINETRIKYSNMLSKIENLYKFSSQKDSSVKLNIEEGKINLENRNILMHTLPLTGIDDVDIEGIESRKELGIISSEWFGRLEKFGECRFCSSFTKSKGLSFISKEDGNVEKTESLIFDEPRLKNSITLIIDADSVELQQLLRLDYFEFLRNKEKDNLSFYTENELEILNSLYEWNNSRESSDGVLSNLNGSSGSGQIAARMNLNWSAIPGGIYSSFVIGILSNTLESNPIAKKAGEIFSVPVINKYGELIQNIINQKDIEQNHK